MKILTTGNPATGLAKAISGRIDGSFASRANGYDLSKESARKSLAELSLGYDVFINASALSDFQQTLVLRTVWDAWRERKKSGHIISIGATNEVVMYGGSYLLPQEKKALRDLNRSLAFSLHKDSNIRCTYLSLGYLDTVEVERDYPEVKKVPCDYVCDVILWLIAQPKIVNINEVSLDRIQSADASIQA